MIKEFLAEESAWADFLISKAALALSSVVLFAALFQLAAGFKDLEAQEELDFLARDFKAAVDKVGAENFPGETQEISYRFDENEVFLASPFDEDLEVYVSGEYVHLKAESGGENFSAVRPFTFRVLPFNESELRGKVYAKFGNDGSEMSPVSADSQEIIEYLRMTGTEEVLLSANDNISIKKELVYIRGSEEVSAFDYILVYQ
ncbi:hypothetical protein [Methanosarcina sp.]|uniref:hypothetical protein n=1 Tax=Methanosarcina sp. TaxID=2213 RepID=UPI002C5217B9|nr:hypothetical protein [Methanosarcina sp.]HOW15436.1 hypothetical protein [Methanosarcina sp.]